MKRGRFIIALVIAPRVLVRPSMLLRLFDSYSEVWRSIQEKEPGACELSSIAVSPHFSGKGVGKGLVKVFIASVNGKSNAVLLTTDATGNDGSNRFYQKLGFVLDGSYERSKSRRMNKYRLQLETPLRKA
jgi:ribosomal protein S18 acetylase RimI-like enzyme